MRWAVNDLSQGIYSDLHRKASPLSLAINKKGASTKTEYLPRFCWPAASLADRGAVNAGKLADLVCIARNPLADISLLTDVSTVIKGVFFLKHKGQDLRKYNQNKGFNAETLRDRERWGGNTIFLLKSGYSPTLLSLQLSVKNQFTGNLLLRIYPRKKGDSGSMSWNQKESHLLNKSCDQ